MAFLLEAHAALAIENGNYEEAGKDAIAIANFAEALGEQPFYMSQEESARLIDILYSLRCEVASGRKMPSELAERITDYTLNFNGREVLADAIAFYTWQSRETFDDIRNWRVDDFDVFFLFYSTAGRSLLNRDQLISTGFGERVSDALRLPYYEGYVILEEIQKDIEDTPWIYFFSRFMTGGIFFPIWLQASDSCACQESQLGLMQIGFALEMYQEQQGEYPQNLEDITPILGCSPPNDPYTGQPFVYEPHQDSFTLYSARGNLIPSKKLITFKRMKTVTSSGAIRKGCCNRINPLYLLYQC